MYIAIAGNIGSGKTTLTEILTRHYNAKAYYEESNNPYIGDFYNDSSGGRSTCKSIFWAVVSSRRSICSHRATT